jgi:hypothetical protein
MRYKFVTWKMSYWNVALLIFQDIEFSIRVSFLELYNEELFDLLGSSDDPLRLKIYEDSTRKVWIVF